MFEKGMKNRGQVTIFIIIAIIIIAAVVAFFAFRGGLGRQEVLPVSLEPVYNSFLECVEDDALVGINLLETQGGYIELPDFEAGSTHMPFSSQLNFLGNPIPYWYYVSANGNVKEQIPSKGDMEGQLEDYLEEQITSCSTLEAYFEQGYEISFDEDVDVDVDVSFGEENVNINIGVGLGIAKAEETGFVRNHEVVIDSKLGSLYDSAVEVYEYEQDTLFLENYGIDVLRMYAPVDGFELQCSPLVWNAQEVFDELQGAIEDNTLSLRTKNNEFVLADEINKYFIVDLDIEEDVRFVNSRNWAYTYEVAPSDSVVMTALPTGNQPGMAALGFCYVPYHFVYNLKYPVLIQVSEGMETFQFPLAVVIEGNKPREALEVTASELADIELCEYANTEMQVDVYNNNLNSVAADISFTCFGKNCPIGKSTEGVLMFPQCANGVVTARADGYATARQTVSTVQPSGVELIMNRMYTKSVNVNLDGSAYNGEAIVSFVSDDVSSTIVYPEQNTIELAQGQYEVQVYIYRDAELTLESVVSEQCVEVPQSGLGGLIGLTKEECFDVEIPEQTIESSLQGGGKQSYYVAESQLTSSTTIDINAESLPVPSDLEGLQENFIAFEEQGLNIIFR